MIETLPVFISVFFILTTLLALYLFILAADFNKVLLVILSLWLVLHGWLAWGGFFLETETIPPHLGILNIPVVIILLLLFITAKGKSFLDTLNQEMLTWVHTVRVPVELVLYWLFVYGQVPELMTFEGRNFDILSGLTAPLIVYFGFRRKVISKKWILAWNFVCLALLFQIVISAVLAAPFPFQQIAFEQPNVGVLYFPFSWLPGFIVPIVLLSHCAQIRFLLNNK